MPFRATPTRDRHDLTAFFQHNIKEPIEACPDLPYRYVVKRSDDTFNITDQIIRDLYEAAIVICDLSGVAANPNVMYELGVRLSISSNPVILIREQHEANEPIFDVGGFYAFEYNPHQYTALHNHILEKLKRFESGHERYESPVIKILETAPRVIQLIQSRRTRLQLQALDTGLYVLLHALSRAILTFSLEMGLDLLAGDGAELTEPELIKSIEARQAELADFDWSKFSFKPFAPPPLTGYLQEPHLYYIMPSPLAETYTTMLFEYYKWFFAAEGTWARPTWNMTFEFLSFTFLLRAGTQALLNLLAPSSEEQAHRMLALYATLVHSTKYLSQEKKDWFFAATGLSSPKKPPQ